MGISFGITLYDNRRRFHRFRAHHTDDLVRSDRSGSEHQLRLLIDREGQITCICYALIGIPIFLLCLTNISAILGDVFRFLYSGLLHILCGCCRIYNRKSKRKVRDRKNSNITADGEVVGVQSADPTWPDAIDEEYANNEGDEEYDDDEDAEMKDIWDRMESRVPTGLVLVVIVGYLCLGAVMFHRFEDWTMTESVYFCFITLSTIGFGDLVSPNTRYSIQSTIEHCRSRESPPVQHRGFVFSLRRCTSSLV